MSKIQILLAIAAIVVTCASICSAAENNITNIAKEIVDGHKVCPAACLLSHKTGRGKASLPKWFFNKKEKTCQTFTYGGSGGNANRFNSKRECNEKCGECKLHNVEALAGSKHPRCDCNYHKIGQGRGCKISVPAPQGWKCQCRYRAFKWGCKGEAIKCDDQSKCPADCISKECCENAKGKDGNCDGYGSIPSFFRQYSASAIGSKVWPKVVERALKEVGNGTCAQEGEACSYKYGIPSTSCCTKVRSDGKNLVCHTIPSPTNPLKLEGKCKFIDTLIV